MSRSARVQGWRGIALRLDGSVVVLVCGAFVLRVLLRVLHAPSAAADDGYLFYLKIAENLVAGHGFCVSPGSGCALRMPVYPMMLSPLVAAGVVSSGVAVLQSIAGAALVWCTSATGQALCGRRTGLLAAAAVAGSPYFVWHDTALQETVFVNLLLMLALWLLVRSPVRGTRDASLAGGLLAAAILTTARVALVVPAMIVWLLIERHVASRRRVARATALALPVLILIGMWTGRNWLVVGAPVLTTESGASLFYANNPMTFSHFPVGSIDRSAGEAVANLTIEQRLALAAVSGDPVAEDRLAARWATQYVRTHPGAVLEGAVRKLWIVLAAEYSPRRGPLVQWGYRGLFLMVHGLAIIGLWRTRRSGTPHGASYAVLLAFFATTAVFWAHTSHKSLIDPVLFLYAAAAMTGEGRTRGSSCSAVQHGPACAG